MIYRVPEKEEDWMAISHPALAKNNRSCATHFCICRTPPPKKLGDVSFRGYPQMARIATTKVASIHLVKRARVVRIEKFQKYMLNTVARFIR
jgi:hypothetical protein